MDALAAVWIEVAPGWLPPGYVETERRRSRGGVLAGGERFGPYASRVFSLGDRTFWITENALRSDDMWARGESLPIGDQHGVGHGSRDGSYYSLQVPWRSDQLLEVTVQRAPPEAREVAVRVAQEVRPAPSVSVDIPLDCDDPLCDGPGHIDVSGSVKEWLARVGGPGATAILANGREFAPPADARRIRQLTVNDRSATLWHSGMRGSTTLAVELSGGRQLIIGSNARRPLREEEAERVAATVRIHGEPDYSWLGRRPG